jgi:hypothetical protein
VTILSENASSTNWGIRHPGSSARVNGVTITVKGVSGSGTLGFSHSFQGVFGLTPIIERTVIDVSGGSQNTGLNSVDNMTLGHVRDVQITASGSTAYGIRLAINGEALRLTNSTIAVQGATSYGIFYSGDGSIHVEQSQIRATGTTSYGVRTGNATEVTIDHSQIAGETFTVFGSIVARIGASRLDGGPVDATGGATCAGVYDESFTFFAGPGCP